jgi:hypothetical protein
MLATIFIWLSVAVIALGLADILLSKTQKGWLSNAVLKLWGALDEAKGWSFADWLKKPRAKWWFAVTVGLGLAILEAVFVFVWHDLFAEWRAQRRGTEPLKLDVFGRLFAALWAGAFVWAFIVYVTRPIFAWLLQFSSTKHLSNKLVISLLGASAALFLSTFFLDELLQGGGVYHVVGNILLTLTLPLGLYIPLRGHDLYFDGYGVRRFGSAVRWRVRGTSHSRVPERPRARDQRLVRGHRRFDQSVWLRLALS